jgi:hypothetical protein
MDVVYGDYKKMPESDIAHIIEVDDNDDSNTEVEEIHLEGCENNETMDDKQDPESSVDENQFTGIDLMIQMRRQWTSWIRKCLYHQI